MPGLHTQHPDPDQLSAFGLGQLSEADSRDIEQHLAACDSCRQTLEDLPADSLVSLLQAAASDTQSGPAGASSDTDSSHLPGESLPPLYKKIAQIIGGKPTDPSATRAPSGTGSARAGFVIPKELDGHARYLVLEPLGAGGMGTVYKAQHRLMERVVALKVVNQLLVNKPGAVERFTREVKAAAQLVHPNIVTAYDAEKVGDMHVLVMEFVEGRTLAQVLEEQRDLPLARACDFVRQAALGLQHALERGMVHRDLKPQNLMLTASGAIKVLDFGLARFVSEQAQADGSTEHGALMGSPDYMAPEQAHDAHAADARADIYGLGCTLYHLLAGQVPFPASSLLAKLEAHRDRQPVRLDKLRQDVPGALARVIEKMMAKDPAQRYQTPALVAEALRPFAQVPALPPEFPARSRDSARPSRRKPVIVAAVAALLLIGAGAWLAPLVFRVETPHGTLIIKTDEPDVQLSVKSGGKEVVLFFPKQKKEIALKAGEYTIELVGGKEGLTLSASKFEIKGAGDRKLVTVELVPNVSAKGLPKIEPEPKADLALPALPSVEELLKTREVLTVAQDGSGGFKTIAEALDKVQQGQVVLVKDKGPYREFISKNLPADVALVSLVGTRIEIPKYVGYAPAWKEGERLYVGASLNAENRFRLAGFEWVATGPRPHDLGGGRLVSLTAAGDLVVERCTFQGPDWLTGCSCNRDGTSDRPARVVFQDNVANRVFEFQEFPGALTVQRNWVASSRWALRFDQRAGSVVVRHNVLSGPWGISFNPVPVDKALPAPGGDLTIHNNVLDVGDGPIAILSDSKVACVLPRSARIVNNILRSRTNVGVIMTPADHELLKERLVVGPNAYQAPPRTAPQSPVVSWPIGPRDVILAKHFLSVEPKDADYLRIAPDGALAKGGAGGDLPTYFGAFPPGPAPKDGDWFTRLRGPER